MLADAFVDDPAWCAVAPRDRERRRRFIEREQRGMLAVARRWGGPVLCVRREGRVAGVTILFAPGRFPPPVRSLAFQALGPALAGPGTVARGLAAQRTLDGGHPKEDHLFVWMLAVDPAVQRGGVGRALLGAALELADRLEVVTHLDTGNPANLPYYAGFGFRVEGEATLPRATRVWFMRRPCLSAPARA